MEQARQALAAAVMRLLRPVVRIMLRQGVSFGEFMEFAKRVYVDVAVHDFTLPGRKQTDSRVSVLTGLSRKEVKNVRALGITNPTETRARYNRAARVISGWMEDRSYIDGWNEPSILPLEGEGPTFSTLVETYSGDVPVRAVLDELQRVGAVERLEDGRIRLLQRAYIPSQSEEDKLNILGEDIALLAETIDHNLECKAEDAYYQRKVAYDNLPIEAIPQLHDMVATQGQRFLEDVNVWLLTQDRDDNPEIKGNGRKYAGVGLYFFEHDVTEEET
jgi:hypothetical protein